MTQKVIRQGAWSYGGRQMYVWIVEQDSDHYYEDFYEGGPDVNDAGKAYYVLYGSRPEVLQYDSRSRTCLSVEEAEGVAEAAAPDLEWVGAKPRDKRS